MLSACRVSVAIGLSLLLLVCSPAFLFAQREGRPLSSAGQAVENEHRFILKALSNDGEWSYVEEPLGEVLSSFAEQLGINLYVDTPALEDFGIGEDTPVTIQLSGISNRSFLSLMLRDLDLAWTLRDGLLWITTTEEGESQLITRAYPVGDLIQVAPVQAVDDPFGDLGGTFGGFGEGGSGGRQKSAASDYDSLIGLITATVEPDSWDTIGGPGSIVGISGALVISQTREVHDLVDGILAGARSIRERLTDNSTVIPPPVSLGGADSKLMARLGKKAAMEYEDEALSDVLEVISRKHDIPVVIDTSALEDFGIGTDTPVSIRIRGLPLVSALRTMLHELDLTYVMRDEVLMITTMEEAESLLQLRLYPVGDLVLPADRERGESGCERGDCDFNPLINAIRCSVEPDSWDNIGGPGAIAPLSQPPVLTISQTEEVHEQVMHLLTELRRVKKLQSAGESTQ